MSNKKKMKLLYLFVLMLSIGNFLSSCESDDKMDMDTVEVPDGYAAYVFPRSSLAAKGVVCELPPVDSGYRGEIHAIVSNVGNEAQTLPKDSRIGQLIIMPVVIADFVNDLGRKRGAGAFGSTGK